MAGESSSSKDELIDFNEVIETDEEEDLKRAFTKPMENSRRGRKAKPEE